MADTMPVVVQRRASNPITLDVDPYDTVESVKAKIQDQTGIAPERQQLSFAGVPLVDGRTLADYNIQRWSTIRLDVSPRPSDAIRRRPNIGAVVAMPCAFGAGLLYWQVFHLPVTVAVPLALGTSAACVALVLAFDGLRSPKCCRVTRAMRMSRR